MRSESWDLELKLKRVTNLAWHRIESTTPLDYSEFDLASHKQHIVMAYNSCTKLSNMCMWLGGWDAAQVPHSSVQLQAPHDLFRLISAQAANVRAATAATELDWAKNLAALSSFLPPCAQVLEALIPTKNYMVNLLSTKHMISVSAGLFRVPRLLCVHHSYSSGTLWPFHSHILLVDPLVWTTAPKKQKIIHSTVCRESVWASQGWERTQINCLIELLMCN